MTRWDILWFWVIGWLNTLLQWIPGANRSFLILSSGRSGSTLLVQYLRCHPSIACPIAEPLNPDTNGLTNVSSHTLVNYLMAQLLSWRRYSGCKVFCQQLEHYRISFAEILAALRDPPILVLYRENTLETFVSLQLAFKTNVWFSQEENNECTKVEVDFEEYKHYVETERQRWRNTLSSFAVRRRKRVHFLSYEELNENKAECLKRVFSFLHLRPCETTAWSKKQNPFGLAHKVSNFEDIKEKLKTFRGHLLTRQWMEGCVPV